MTSKVCVQCETPHNDDTCPECGSSLYITAMMCPACNTIDKPEDIHPTCFACGYEWGE